MKNRLETISDQLDDADLMRRTAAGDRKAFGVLVDRHHQRALNLAYRLSGDEDLARDIVQESFLRIFKAVDRYTPQGRFTTYLFTVVRNATIEFSRRRRRRREEPLRTSFDLDPIPGEIHHGVPGPEAPDVITANRELSDRLALALLSLGENLRAVFVLSELEGLSYAEIARICRIPEGTVASRKYAAIRQLRTILSPVRARL